MAKTIFLPFYYNGESIQLVAIETYGRPVRYFETSDDPLLRAYWDSLEEGHRNIVTISNPIKIGEAESYTISYNFVRISDDWRISTEEALVSHPLHSIDDLFALDMPAELQLAVLKVASVLLQEPKLGA